MKPTESFYEVLNKNEEKNTQMKTVFIEKKSEEDQQRDLRRDKEKQESGKSKERFGMNG